MKYKCPHCQTVMEWRSDNPNKPFCSERCKNKDFIGWANEQHALPGTPDYDDLLSGELEAAIRQDNKLH